MVFQRTFKEVLGNLRVLGHHKFISSLETPNFFPFVLLSPVLSLFEVPQIHPESSRALTAPFPNFLPEKGGVYPENHRKKGLCIPLHSDPKGSGIWGEPMGVPGSAPA